MLSGHCAAQSSQNLRAPYFYHQGATAPVGSGAYPLQSSFLSLPSCVLYQAGQADSSDRRRPGRSLALKVGQQRDVRERLHPAMRQISHRGTGFRLASFSAACAAIHCYQYHERNGLCNSLNSYSIPSLQTPLKPLRPLSSMGSRAHVARAARPAAESRSATVRALIIRIRIGFWDILYQNYIKESLVIL